MVGGRLRRIADPSISGRMIPSPLRFHPKLECGASKRNLALRQVGFCDELISACFSGASEPHWQRDADFSWYAVGGASGCQPVGQNVRGYPLLRPGQQLAEVTAVAEHQATDCITQSEPRGCAA